MGFFSKLFGKNNEGKKVDSDPERDFQCLYGVFKPTSFNKIVDRKNEIKDKCHGIMDFDNEAGNLLERYMDSLSVSDDRKIVYLQKLAMDKDVAKEFARYLAEESYDLEDAISVKNRTAKTISVENPELTAIEVYIKLIEEKKQAGE